MAQYRWYSIILVFVFSVSADAAYDCTKIGKVNKPGFATEAVGSAVVTDVRPGPAWKKAHLDAQTAAKNEVVNNLKPLCQGTAANPTGDVIKQDPPTCYYKDAQGVEKMHSTCKKHPVNPNSACKKVPPNFECNWIFKLPVACCQPKPICGDSNIDPGETCDDGNGIDGDGCNHMCQTEICGNGVHDLGEGCDDGNLISGDGCDSSCFYEDNTCGDGNLEVGESCDDGNTTPGDGCDEFCMIEEPGMCGNWTIEFPEECDEGAVDTASCDMDCTFPMCGDGHWNSPAGEGCDDGNTVAGDGCDEMCQIENPPMCGDWIVNGNEECDQGAVDTATCDLDCTFPMCGDGHWNSSAGEGCDDGNTVAGDGCDEMCQIEMPKTP